MLDNLLLDIFSKPAFTGVPYNMGQADIPDGGGNAVGVLIDGGFGNLYIGDGSSNQLSTVTFSVYANSSRELAPMVEELKLYHGFKGKVGTTNTITVKRCELVSIINTVDTTNKNNLHRGIIILDVII